MDWFFDHPVLFFGIVAAGGAVAVGFAAVAALNERKSKRELAAHLSRKV